MGTTDRVNLSGISRELGELQAPERPAAYVQERAAVRHPLDAAVRVEFLRTCRDPRTLEPVREVRVRDISTSGIGFCYPEVMFRGERVRLTLLADGQPIRVVEARVVWCRRAAKDNFLVGAALEADMWKEQRP